MAKIPDHLDDPDRPPAWWDWLVIGVPCLILLGFVLYTVLIR